MPSTLELAKSGRCVRCGRQANDPHHIKPPIINVRRRTHDFVVPVCRSCHNWIQQTRDGIIWEREMMPLLYGIAISYYLWDNPIMWQKLFQTVLEEKQAEES